MMIDATISPSGEVLVGGHYAGRLAGFRFHPAHATKNNNAEALATLVQQCLAAEYEARAERLACSTNSDLAIGQDGIIRWMGQPVATLARGESILTPRIILLADEQLTETARDKILWRIDRFVAHSLETALGPLFGLLNADALVGLTRDVARCLVENLGILVRRNVADDIRKLDQDSRAALRRLGVRFGAWHIFMPALLKPEPARAITHLWALEHGAREDPGYGDVVQILAAGRTSVCVNLAFNPDFYRLSGYHILGRRAVRIDILERLSDLIRSALGWRPDSVPPLPRPEGAWDGKHFFVTPAMMSVLGARAGDVEEILMNLGYKSHVSDQKIVGACLQENMRPGLENTRSGIFPAAEPVGPVFYIVPGLSALPAAEPVGFISRDGRPADISDRKPVILWCYQSKQESRRSCKKHQKPRIRGKDHAEDRKKGLRHVHSGRESSLPDIKKLSAQKKKGNTRKSSRPVRAVDPNSPFGKLAILLDRMKKQGSE